MFMYVYVCMYVMYVCNVYMYVMYVFMYVCMYVCICIMYYACMHVGVMYVCIITIINIIAVVIGRHKVSLQHSNVCMSNSPISCLVCHSSKTVQASQLFLQLSVCRIQQTVVPTLSTLAVLSYLDVT